MALIDDLTRRLRSVGSDTSDIEVKGAAGGLPGSVTQSLCALANRPGGGWLILGLDERDGFRPLHLPDLNASRQGVVGKARSCTPPVGVEFVDAEVDGVEILLAEVAECPISAKPCRVNSSGQAWVRSWDGDFAMSALEDQAFLAQREPPRADRRPGPEARRADLDPVLVSLWSETARQLDPGGLGRFSGDEQLFHGGVLVRDPAGGETLVPSVPGLLALGTHPQRFFPRYVVNLAVMPSPDTVNRHRREGAAFATTPRATQLQTVSGPIPLMLDQALQWARKVFENGVVARSDGAVHDVWTYPLEAFCELIGNALVHRDLHAWSDGMAVEVRLYPDRLVVASPGGLHGITVPQPGRSLELPQLRARRGMPIHPIHRRRARRRDPRVGNPPRARDPGRRRTPAPGLRRQRHQIHRPGAAE